MLIPKKYHIHVIALLAVAAIMFIPSYGRKVDSESLAKGTAAAEEFLQLVDAEEYNQSWEISSDLMRDKIFIEVWSRQVPVMRDKVGPLISREQNEASSSESAEGAPDGEYMVLKYSSSFQKQQSAIETIILVLEEDRQWRVAGYFIK